MPLPICWGRTPLHQAVKNNHADVVRILVEDGKANVNVKDERLITPLLLAGSMVNRDDLNEMTKFVEIVRILVTAKAIVDIKHPDTGIDQSSVTQYRTGLRYVIVAVYMTTNLTLPKELLKMLSTYMSFIKQCNRAQLC